MSPKPRVRLSADERRRQIVDAATTLISVQGYRGFSIAATAAACGITRAGVLHHFASKEDLLVEVLTSRDIRSGEEFLRVAETASRPAFRKALDQLVADSFTSPRIAQLYVVLASESLDPDHAAHSYFAQRLNQSREFLARAIEQFESEGDVRAIELLSFLDGLQLTWLRDPTINPMEHWSRFTDRLFPTPAHRT